jgi:hypothetical protein
MKTALSRRDVWEDEHSEKVPMLDELELDDCPYHAPTAFVEAKRREREERNRRDREDLVDLWREELRWRRREQAARYLHWR